MRFNEQELIVAHTVGECHKCHSRSVGFHTDKLLREKRVVRAHCWNCNHVWFLMWTTDR